MLPQLPSTVRTAARRLAPPLLALVAYWGVWDAGLVYDDLASIRDNPAFQQGPHGDWWAAAFEQRWRSPLSNRPVACMTLVLDRWLFGATATGHHVTNLLLHLLATVLVGEVVRAALRAPNLAKHFDDARARLVAFAASALWSVHPMTVDAVGYATQRSVLLMAVFLLGTLLALLRGERAPQRRLPWCALAIGCLLLGMASKEEFVAAPLLLPLFWRAFVAPDWRAVRARWPLFLAAAATWALLYECVHRGPTNPTVGYDTTPRATAFEWLQTQAVVVGHYLRAAVWPTGLRGCYDWPILRELGKALVPGAVIVALVAATAVACVRRPHWGFLGAWFFLLLAPTSTVLPIVTELAAERRMYLPLLAIVVPVALGLTALSRRVARWRPGSVLLGVLLLVLVPWTWRRVAVYRDEEPFWTDAFAQRDPRSRSYVASIVIDNYARIVRGRGEIAASRDLFAEALQCEHAPTTVRLHFACSLLELGDLDGARRELRQVAAEAPTLGDRLDGTANAVLEAYHRDPAARQLGAADPRLQDAVINAQAATMMDPRRPQFVNTLGNVQTALGRLADAEASFRRAIELDPAGAQLYVNLVEVLLRSRRIADAQSTLRSLCDHAPQDLALRLQLGEQYLRRGELDLAQPLFEAALRLSPDHARARAALAEIEARRRR